MHRTNVIYRASTEGKFLCTLDISTCVAITVHKYREDGVAEHLAQKPVTAEPV